MDKPSQQILNTFDLNSLPFLDTAVLGALELFSERELPTIDISRFKRPLVVGSGNAEATGRIIFEKTAGVFGSESTVDEKLRDIPDIDEVVVISASGAKHAPIIAGKAKAAGKHITLVTNTPDSPARQQFSAGELTDHVFPKNREPYTYNTSTYMAFILGYTRENAADIKRFIEEKIDSLTLPDFSKFNKYYVIVPPELAGISRLLQVKFIELFGRNIARDIETSENIKHATTVAPSDELFISLGLENTLWGKPENRLNVPLPGGANYGAIMAVGYYIVAQIQRAQPQYFKQNIAAYCELASKIFGENLSPIVEGNL